MRLQHKLFAHSPDFHTAVDAALDFVCRHRVAPDDTERIDMALPPPVANGLMPSFDRQRRPSGTREAQRSLPFALSVALSRAPDVRPGDTFFDAFAPDRLADPRVLPSGRRPRHRPGSVGRRLESTDVARIGDHRHTGRAPA